MNLLTANFEWKRAKDRIVNERCRFSSGILDLHVERIHSFVFDNDNIFYNDKQHTACAIIGYVSNLQKIKSDYSIDCKNDVKVVEQLYSQVGPKLIYDLDGVFSIVIWDGEKQKGYIFQDEYGSNLPLYYINTKEQFIISTSVKEILKQASFKRELNFQAVQDFLKLPIAPNKSTLIKGINKLLPQQYILIDGVKGCFELKSTNPRRKRMTKRFAKENLIGSIEKNTGILLDQLNGEGLACTLSGGFDTNTILHFLAKSTADITAVTIGGKRINEIHKAKKIVNQYDNVKHTSSVVGENKLGTFPDMVWRLEGYVSECGIFLQSELAEHLQKEGIKSIFLADCADQVLDQYRKSLTYLFFLIIRELVKCLYKNTIDIGKRRILMYTEKFLCCRKNIDIDLNYVVKKSGIMLNSYGIQGIYPFLNRETVAVSKALGILNARKFSYRKEVKRLLGEKKSNIIGKQAGTTDIDYLFEGKEGVISKLLSSKLVEEIISKEQIARITNNPTSYYDLILQILFIYLFNELFITGNYDSIIDESNFDIALDEFFG